MTRGYKANKQQSQNSNHNYPDFKVESNISVVLSPNIRGLTRSCVPVICKVPDCYNLGGHLPL